MVNSSLYNRYFGKGGKGGDHGHDHGHGNNIINQNFYQKFNMTGGGMSSFGKLINKKKELLIATFSNLIAQLGITYYVMTNYSGSSKKISGALFWGLFLFQLSCIFALAYIPMPIWIKFILFSLFSGSFGIMLSSLQNVLDKNIIHMAVAGTMGIFVVMFLLGVALLLFGIQLGYNFAGGLFIALLLLIITQIVLFFTGAYSRWVKIVSVIGLFLFSLFIIYDTNHILQREYYGDFITASMDYYLDIINIFSDLVGYNSN